MVKAIVRELMRDILMIGPHYSIDKTTRIDPKTKDAVTTEKVVVIAKSQQIYKRGGNELDYERVERMSMNQYHFKTKQLYYIVKNTLILRESKILNRVQENDLIKPENVYKMWDYCLHKLMEMGVIKPHDVYYKSTVLIGAGDNKVPIGQQMLSEEQVQSRIDAEDDEK